MQTLTLKIPDDLNMQLQYAVETLHTPKSELVRAAVADYLKRKLKKKKPSMYDLVKDDYGYMEGPGDLSYNPKYMEGFGQTKRPFKI